MSLSYRGSLKLKSESYEQFATCSINSFLSSNFWFPSHLDRRRESNLWQSIRLAYVTVDYCPPFQVEFDLSSSSCPMTSSERFWELSRSPSHPPRTRSKCLRALRSPRSTGPASPSPGRTSPARTREAHLPQPGQNRKNRVFSGAFFFFKLCSYFFSFLILLTKYINKAPSHFNVPFFNAKVFNGPFY